VRVFSLLSILALTATACTDGQIRLSYGTETGRRLAYELRLEARIERTLSGSTRKQDIQAGFRAEQEVLERLAGGRATARMTLRPTSLVVDGRSQQAGTAREFMVTLGPDGRILEITGGGRDELEDEALAPLGIDRLLPRLRPVLPGRPVTLGEDWRNDSEFEDSGGRFTLRLRSRLASVGVVDGRTAALVRTSYASPVSRREIFSNAVTEVRGQDVGTQAAWFALDGYLVRSAGDSVGSYRLVFRPPGGGTAGVAPVQGALRVRLHTEMSLLVA
jgi:hypothetical protein